MRILWHSNAQFVGTGYGRQTNLFVPRIAALGHEVIVSAYYGLAGTTMNIDGVQIVPSYADSYGNDVLLGHAKFYEADIVIGLLDQWVLNPAMIAQLPRYVAWTPIDHDPAPPAVIHSVNRAWRVVAYSKFGQRKLQEAGLKADYIPHGVDTSVYKPMDKTEAREALGVPKDRFIVGMVMANKGFPPRKAWEQQIGAFAEFQREHNDAYLYMHTDAGGYKGVDLKRLLELYDVPLDAAQFCPQYPLKTGMFSDEHMAITYNAFDVLLNATRGEGFGLPIIEAQACGVPVIVTDFTAMPELAVWPSREVAVSEKVLTQQDSFHAIPSQSEILLELNLLFNGGVNDEPEYLRKHALTYDADRVTEQYWKPYLEKLAEEIEVKKRDRSR